MLALCFVLAGVAEAVVRDRTAPDLLMFQLTGALWLCCLMVRRTRPVLAISVLAAGGVIGSVATQLFWPAATDSGGVWIIAMMVAAYSLGAHARGRVVALGVLLPAVVVSSADLVARSGWDRASGVLFVTVFIGLLPTVAGTVVRVRRERLVALDDQREQIVRAQRAEQESVVLAERLRVAERLRPTLIDGLRGIAAAADSGAEPLEVETSARALLARTREEVVALAAPVDGPVATEMPVADHVRVLRTSAQPWTALAAGAVVVGLYVETTNVLRLAAPAWSVLPAAIVVGAPVALAWRWPIRTAVLAWAAVAAYSHLVAPLAGTLTEAAIAVSLAFIVAALAPRGLAAIGLAVCWLGQLTVAWGPDAIGGGALLLGCWLGGLALNESSRLLEQARTNNHLLAQQRATAAEGAVVQERLRLAREVHDTIGHSLTVVALQAGAARRLSGHDPERARQVMQTVAAAALDGIAALDDEPRPWDVTALVERLRAAGLDVEDDLRDLPALPESQRLIAVRTIQEGLTNAIRHAPGSRLTISVRRRGDVIAVQIANSAPLAPGSGPGSGRGLVGIRERVLSAAAGEVTWGPVAGGGFEVLALLGEHGMTAAAR